MTDRLMDVQAVADLLGVPTSWVYDHREVPRIKVGHHLRFRRADVEAYLDGQTVHSGSGRTARSGRRRHKY
jgi:excisionase family DNA binding protein